MTPDPTDRCTELMLSAQAGDVEAFEDLHAALAPVIRSYVASLAGKLSPADHDDLVQETMAAVWHRLGDYRAEASAVTFSLAIAKKLTLKAMSRRNKSPIVYTGALSGTLGERELCQQSPSLAVESCETQAQLQRALAQLTEVQRQAIELDLLRGLPRSESLKLTNCTPNQFANRLLRGVQTLKQHLNSP